MEVKINDKPVIYQLINGYTKEEIIYKKNTLGYIRAKAKKIGIGTIKRINLFLSNGYLNLTHQ